MRAPDIALSVLFPIFIAIGIALGMDAVSADQFWVARAAFIVDDNAVAIHILHHTVDENQRNAVVNQALQVTTLNR